jgi:hypothetical protein
MWLIQFLIAWAQAPQTANLLFAALALCLALGASGRTIALLTALLYLALALG